MSVVTSGVSRLAGGVFKGIGKGLGLGGGGGEVQDPKKKKELGLLSLSELIDLRGEEKSAVSSQLSTELSAAQKSLGISEAALGTANEFTRGGIERDIGKFKEQITGITTRQTDLATGKEGRLGEINTRIRELTRQRLGTRTRRATAISTLLGRGR